MQTLHANGLPALVALFASALPAAETASPYAALLRDNHIETTPAGLRKYFTQLHPSAEQRQQAKRWIDALGDSDSFAEREQATAQLMAMPLLPVELLTAAAQGDDPEVRWRATRILNEGKPNAERLLHAALKTVEQEKTPGIIDELLRAIPLCDKPYLQFAARRAVAAAAGEKDVDTLRQGIKEKNIEVAVAAIGGLGQVLGPQAADDLHPLFDHADDRIQLAAAIAAAGYGDRASLPVLWRLLSSDSIDVRAASAGALRESTGQTFGFAAYDAADKRDAVRAKWKDWIDANGRTAKLHFPLTAGGDAEIGHTIIAAYSEGRAYVIDAQKKQIFEFGGGYSGPWGGTRLPNGNFLINWYGSHCVVEYDTQQKQVWKHQAASGQSTWSAQRLPNGNTLIAAGSEAVEVDAQGKAVWKHNLEVTLTNAVRLENGNTLMATVASPGRVVEVDPAGKEVLEIKDLKMPYRVTRLANGNTLVADKGSNRVVEFDASGKNEVWSHPVPTSPNAAQRLSNGNTLISHQQGVYEVDSTGKVVWEHAGGHTLAWRY